MTESGQSHNQTNLKFSRQQLESCSLKQESRAENSVSAEAGRPAYKENETGVTDLTDNVSGAKRLS